VRLHRHVVGRHQAPDRLLGVAEELRRDPPLALVEEVQEALRHGAGQLLEEGRAVVGRHLVEDLGDLALGHAADQRLLVVDVEVLEDLERQLARQDAERHGLDVVIEVPEHLRHVVYGEVREELAHRGELPGADQVAYLVGQRPRVDCDVLRHADGYGNAAHAQRCPRGRREAAGAMKQCIDPLRGRTYALRLGGP